MAVLLSTSSLWLTDSRIKGECDCGKSGTAEIRKSLSSIILHDMCLDAPQARR